MLAFSFFYHPPTVPFSRHFSGSVFFLVWGTRSFVHSGTNVRGLPVACANGVHAGNGGLTGTLRLGTPRTTPPTPALQPKTPLRWAGRSIRGNMPLSRLSKACTPTRECPVLSFVHLPALWGLCLGSMRVGCRSTFGLEFLVLW